MNPLSVYVCIYYESSPSETHASSSESHCLVAAEFADSDFSLGDACFFDLRLRVTCGLRRRLLDAFAQQAGSFNPSKVFDPLLYGS